jgi:molecular chaperone DnaK
MVKDAEAHAADDQARRDAIDARNQADALVYSVEKTFTEQRTKLSPDVVGRVETALESAKVAVKSEDVASLRSAIAELQQASHQMAEALYRASQQQPGSGGGPSPDVKEGEVVDAEYAETR